MAKTAGAQRRPNLPAGPQSKTQSGPPSDPAAHPVPPLKPRPTLLRVLSVVMAVWIAFLLWMYFSTVRGDKPPGPTTDQSTPTAALPTRPGASG